MAAFADMQAAADPALRIAQADTASEDVYWRKVRKWNSVVGYRAYLKAFPEGLYAEDAREKIARLQGATGNPAPSNEPAAPNKPIPNSFLTSAKIIQFIESHPAFADAPPVRVRRLKLSYTFPNDPDNYMKETISYDWLRPGLVKERKYTRSPFSDGGVLVNDFEHIAFLNGFLSVASNSSTSAPSFGFSIRSRTIYIEIFRGKLFPLAEGNEIVFRYRHSSLEKGESSIWESGYEIRVVGKRNAADIDTRLEGNAWETHITYKFGRPGETPGIKRRKAYFVDMLGVFLVLEETDPDQPRISWTAKIDSFSR